MICTNPLKLIRKPQTCSMSWEASEDSGVALLTGMTSLQESPAAEKIRPDDVMETQLCGAAERKRLHPSGFVVEIVYRLLMFKFNYEETETMVSKSS